MAVRFPCARTTAKLAEEGRLPNGLDAGLGPEGS